MRQFLVCQLPRHLDSDVAAEGPSTDAVRPLRANSTNRRDIGRGQSLIVRSGAAPGSAPAACNA